MSSAVSGRPANGGQPEVAIVGAGPTGVTAAILLAQFGVRTLVLDRWPDVFPQPRAVHLDDEIYRVLAALGVAEEFEQVSISGAGLRLMSPDHRTLAQFDRTDPRTSNGYPQANMFDQPDLEAILRDRMYELDLITFVGNVEVTAVRPHAGAGPEIEYVDLDTREKYLVRPRFVFGCDGANSLTRRSIGSSMKNLGFAEQRWLVVDIAAERDLGHWAGVHQVCDGTRAATYMRIGRNRHRWEFELLDHESAADFESLAALASLLAPWERDTTGFELVRLTEYTFRAQLADKWREAGVFILGDAAHLTPPFIGQGMGAGIRDAFNLSWKVAGVVNGSLAKDVLDSYQPERAVHARAMIRLAMTVGRAMTGGGALGDRARELLIPRIVHVPGLRGRVLDSATPPLASSVVNDRRRFRSGITGTLCPNAVLAAGGRFDDTTAGQFVLVHRGSLGAIHRRQLEAGGVRLVDVAAADELDQWLGAVAAALVRPDRTVLAAGKLDDVVQRFSRLAVGAGNASS